MVHNIDILILASFYILHLQNIRLFLFYLYNEDIYDILLDAHYRKLDIWNFQIFFFFIFGVDNQDKFFYLV